MTHTTCHVISAIMEYNDLSEAPNKMFVEIAENIDLAYGYFLDDSRNFSPRVQLVDWAYPPRRWEEVSASQNTYCWRWRDKENFSLSEWQEGVSATDCLNQAIQDHSERSVLTYKEKFDPSFVVLKIVCKTIEEFTESILKP